MIKRVLSISCCLVFFISCASTKKAILPPAQEEAANLNQRGIELVEKGDISRALAEFQGALKLNRTIDNRKGVAIALLNIGRVYLESERYADARGVLEEAVSVPESIGDKQLMAEGYATTGKYHYATGNDLKAVEFLERAIELDRKEDHKTIGGRLNVLGLVYLRNGKVKEAEGIFKEALLNNMDSGNRIEIANSYRGMGDTLEAKGLLKEAEDQFQKALSSDKLTRNSRKIAIDLARLGNFSLKGKYHKEALDYFMRAYDVNLNSDHRAAAARDIDNIIKVYKETGEIDKARFYEGEKERLLRVSH